MILKDKHVVNIAEQVVEKSINTSMIALCVIMVSFLNGRNGFNSAVSLHLIRMYLISPLVYDVKIVGLKSKNSVTLKSFPKQLLK